MVWAYLVPFILLHPCIGQWVDIIFLSLIAADESMQRYASTPLSLLYGSSCISGWFDSCSCHEGRCIDLLFSLEKPLERLHTCPTGGSTVLISVYFYFFWTLYNIILYSSQHITFHIIKVNFYFKVILCNITLLYATFFSENTQSSYHCIKKNKWFKFLQRGSRGARTPVHYNRRSPRSTNKPN